MLLNILNSIWFYTRFICSAHVRGSSSSSGTPEEIITQKTYIYQHVFLDEYERKFIIMLLHCKYFTIYFREKENRNISIFISKPSLFTHMRRKESCQENMHEEGCRLTARIFLSVRARLHLQSDRNNYQSDL